MLERIPWRFVLPSLLVGGLLVVILLALIGPVIGSIFSDISSNLEFAAVPYAPPDHWRWSSARRPTGFGG